MNILKSFGFGKEKLKNKAANLVQGVSNAIKSKVVEAVDTVKQNTFVQDLSNTLNEKIHHVLFNDPNKAESLREDRAFDFTKENFSIIGNIENTPDTRDLPPVQNIPSELPTTEQPLENETPPIEEASVNKKHIFGGVLKAKKTLERQKAVEKLHTHFGTPEKLDNLLKILEIQKTIRSLESELVVNKPQEIEGGGTVYRRQTGKKRSRAAILEDIMYQRGELGLIYQEGDFTSSKEVFDEIFRALSEYDLKAKFYASFSKDAEKELSEEEMNEFFFEHASFEEQMISLLQMINGEKLLPNGNTALNVLTSDPEVFTPHFIQTLRAGKARASEEVVARTEHQIIPEVKQA